MPCLNNFESCQKREHDSESCKTNFIFGPDVRVHKSAKHLSASCILKRNDFVHQNIIEEVHIKNVVLK